jgi:hypothetical protein
VRRERDGRIIDSDVIGVVGGVAKTSTSGEQGTGVGMKLSKGEEMKDSCEFEEHSYVMTCHLSSTGNRGVR